MGSGVLEEMRIGKYEWRSAGRSREGYGLDALDAGSWLASNRNMLWRKVLDAVDALDAGFGREVGKGSGAGGVGSEIRMTKLE